MGSGCYVFFPRRCRGTYCICLWFAVWRHHEKKLSTAAKWCHRCYQRDVHGGWVLPRRPALVPACTGSGARFERPRGYVSSDFRSSQRIRAWTIDAHIKRAKVTLYDVTLQNFRDTGKQLSFPKHLGKLSRHWKTALISRAPGQITQIIQSSVVKVRPAKRKSDSPKTRVPKIKSELPVMQKPPQWQVTAVCSVWFFTLTQWEKTYSQRRFLDLVSTLWTVFVFTTTISSFIPIYFKKCLYLCWLAQWSPHGIWHVCI